MNAKKKKQEIRRLREKFHLSRKMAEEAKGLSERELVQHLEELRKGWKNEKVQVLHEEPSFAVIEKPAGVPSHPVSLWDRETITHWAFAHFPEVREGFPLPQPTLTPHRLDTGTSGVLVVARTQEGFQLWRQRFHDHQVTKTYLALALGRARQHTYTVKGYLNYLSHGPVKMGFAHEGLYSESRIEVLEQYSHHFLCQVTCQTGVTHQVRVHLAELGHPLLGDVRYGAPEDVSRPFHCLHAWKLEWGRRTFEASRSGCF